MKMDELRKELGKPRAKPIAIDTEGVEILAESIIQVSEAAKALLSSKLTEKALLLLLSHSSGLGQRECKKVLDAAANLHMYVKKK